MENIKTADERFFVDQRSGNIAVRDREHPKYNSSYPGLHQDTPDVIFYAHGFQGGSGWTVNDFDIVKAHDVCNYLNASLQSYKDKERISELQSLLNDSLKLTRRLVNEYDDLPGQVLPQYAHQENNVRLLHERLQQALSGEPVVSKDKIINNCNPFSEYLVQPPFVSKDKEEIERLKNRIAELEKALKYAIRAIEAVSSFGATTRIIATLNKTLNPTE